MHSKLETDVHHSVNYYSLMRRYNVRSKIPMPAQSQYFYDNVFDFPFVCLVVTIEMIDSMNDSLKTMMEIREKRWKQMFLLMTLSTQLLY